MQTLFIVVSSLCIFTACNLQRTQPTSVQEPTLQQPTILVQDVVTVTESVPSSTQPPATDPTDWQIIDEGLEWQTIVPEGNSFAQMNVLRIDPDLHQFRAMYQAGNPQYLSDWQAINVDAVAIINANFFSPDNTILGNLVSDGIRFGETFRNTGGTFLLENGVPSIRSNRTQPYQGQPVEQAVEGFPSLVENGESIYFNSNPSPVSRRTIIAQDTDGHILLMVTPFIGLSLTDLSQYLPTTDLNIVHALNLDGGGSSMMYVQPIDYTISSFDPVPAVLAVYRR